MLQDRKPNADKKNNLTDGAGCLPCTGEKDASVLQNGDGKSCVLDQGRTHQKAWCFFHWICFKFAEMEGAPVILRQCARKCKGDAGSCLLGACLSLVSSGTGWKQRGLHSLIRGHPYGHWQLSGTRCVPHCHCLAQQGSPHGLPLQYHICPKQWDKQLQETRSVTLLTSSRISYRI